MKRKAFTIVELVVYMGILSILLMVFIDMFATLVNRQLETESLSSVQQDANYLLSRLNYDFSQSKNIQVPATASSPSASLTLLNGSTPYYYFLKSDNLIASHSGILDQLNSSETTISNVSFQRLGIGNARDVVQVKCDITSKSKKQSGYDVTHFSTTLGIREK